MTIETPEDRSYLVDVEDGLLRLSFNRPEQANAMNSTMVAPLTALFREAQSRTDIRAILVRGEGKVFSAGGDVAGFRPTLAWDVAARQDEFRGRITRLGALTQAVAGFDGPIVVAVRGAVAGASMVFPLGADHVIGDASALFVFAHIGIALSPDGGVSALLPRVVGERSARSLLLTGARVKADDALRLGLLNQIVSPEELDAKAIAVAKRLAAGPQRAIKLTKQLVREGTERPLVDQLSAETDGIVASVAEEDFHEGVTAFLDKRPPSFPSAR